MLIHGAGAVGRIRVRGQEYPDLPATPPAIDLDFTQSLPVGWTFTRASANATNSTYMDGPNVTTYTTYPANVPRFMTFGLLMEPTRTNLFLNSEAPVTQTITVGVGTYICWMLSTATGSVACAAGTAVGTGFGTATHGSFVTMVITTAGTVICTCTAPVTRVQFELGAMPTSYIPATGTAQTRQSDVLYSVVTPGMYNLSQGTYFVEYASGGTMPDNAIIFYAGGNDIRVSLGLNGDAAYAYTEVAVSPDNYIDVSSSSPTGQTGGFAWVYPNNAMLSINRVASAVKVENASVACNGVLGQVYDPGDLPRPNAITYVFLFSGGSSGTPGVVQAAVYLRSFRYWSTALTDSQLQAITATPSRRGPLVELDFTRGVLPRRLTFTRGSPTGVVTVTDARVTDAPGAPYTAWGVSNAYIPRMLGSDGLLLEPGRTQYFGNSNAPITRPTAALGNNFSHVVAVVGTGSLTLSNGTTTFTVLAGVNPVVPGQATYISVPVNGTLNCTVNGQLDRVHFENVNRDGIGISPSTFMHNAGTSARGTEWCTMPTSGWFNMKEHTYYIECLTPTYTAGLNVLFSAGNAATDRDYILIPMPDYTKPFIDGYAATFANNTQYASDFQQESVALNVWHKIAYTVDTTKLLIQSALDGLQGAPAILGAPFNGYPTSICIGATSHLAGGGASSMQVRNARFYDYAMTEDELIKLTMGSGSTLNLNFMNSGVLDKRITFSRAGTVGTYFDSSGLLQNAAVNYAFQSSTMGVTATWPVTRVTSAASTLSAPDGSMTATKITEDTTVTNTHYTQQVIAGIAVNAPITASVYMQNNTRRYAAIQLLDNTTQANTTTVYIDLLIGTISATATAGAASGASASIIPVGKGWYRITLTTKLSATATTGAIMRLHLGTSLSVISYTGDGVSSVNVWGAQLEAGSVATSYITTTTAAASGPRWDYDPATYALRGLLIEEARINVLLNSGNLSTMTSFGATRLANNTVAPDGTTTAMRFTEDSTTNEHYLTYSITPTANVAQTFSAFVKAGTKSKLAISLRVGTAWASGFACGAFADLVAGTITAVVSYSTFVAPTAFSIQPVGNGWFRISITATAAASPTACELRIGMANDASTLSYLGDGASYVYAWGIQLEASGFPTSYIPTTAAAVTRNADVCWLPTTEWLSATPNTGTLFLEATRTAPQFGAAPASLALINSVVTVDQIGCGFLSVSNYVTMRGNSADASSVYNVGIAPNPRPLPFKVAHAFTPGRQAGAVNGSGVVTIAAATIMASTPDIMVVGGLLSTTAGGRLNGWVRRVMYWPRVLPDTELQAVTKIGS